MEERRGVYRALVGKPGENRPLGRSRRRWEYNIKMTLKWSVRVWTKSSWPKVGGGHF